MSKRFHDTELVNKDWWLRLSPTYKSLVFWIEKYQTTSGIWDINLYKFCMDYWKGEVQPEDINLEEFAHACNIDSKIRIMFIDNGRKIFYTPTIKFQEGKKMSDQVTLRNNFKHIGILQQLGGYPETREWALDQVNKGKISIDEKLGKHVASRLSESLDLANFYYQLSCTCLPPQARQQPIVIEKEKIKQRDNYECGYCEDQKESYQLEVDHIIPVSKGGDEYPDNKIAACKECNHEKSNADVIEFIKKRGVAPSERLSNHLLKLAGRGKIPYPSLYPIGIGIGIGIGEVRLKEEVPITENNKRKKEKEKKKPRIRYFTYDQLTNLVTTGKEKMSDYVITNRMDDSDRKMWIKKPVSQ